MTNVVKQPIHICELRVLLFKAYVEIVREINRKHALLPLVLPLHQLRAETQGQRACEARRKSWHLLITSCFET